MRAPWTWFRSVSLILVAASVTIAAYQDGPTRTREDQREIEALAKSWVHAVARRDPSFVELLSDSGRAYYGRMRDYALNAEAETLEQIDVLDQLQVLLLRKMLKPIALERMDAADLLRFALAEGFIGMELRESDELRDLTVESKHARGRLYKFGRDERPDSGWQYFVREGGRWRVELRGELERRRADFDALIDRSRLSESEVAFFILEMRLMQKIEPKDFVPPAARSGRMYEPRASNWPLAKPEMRVVAIRHDLGQDGASAVVIEDRAQSLRYILKPGESLPFAPSYRVLRIEEDAAILTTGTVVMALGLAEQGEALDPAQHRPSLARRRAGATLLSHAWQGAGRAGLMAQWRNVGLRSRPQLLQQAWLTPVHSKAMETGSRMLGLRVRQLVEGSFWQQIGLEQGDLLTRINNRRVDSLNAWQEVMDVAQNDRTITVTIERSATELRFRTRTIEVR